MSSWLIPRDEMTTDQLRAIAIDPSEHRVIFGPPGSGKTQVLLHRARYLSDSLTVSPERFKIFVFTKALKEYIASAVDLLDLPRSCVVTWDGWCRDYYERHIGKKIPWNAAEKAPDFPAIRRAVLEQVQAQSSFLPPYEFALVDEGQDLDSDAFQILRAIAEHVTVCVDHKQQIYEGRSSEADVLGVLGLRKRNLSLLDAFRCSPYIASLAAQFIDGAEEQSYFRRQTRSSQSGRETPLLFAALDFEEEKERLIEILRVRRNQGESVAVLFGNNRQLYGFAQGIRAAGMEVETPKEMDFTSDLPKLMTYYGAKGLTFDTVLMPRLVPHSFPKYANGRIDRLLFVGIARATKWVYMSTVRGEELPSLARLEPLIETGTLTLQEGGDLAATAADRGVKVGSGGAEEDDLLDFL